MKIVINLECGHFSLSKKAKEMLKIPNDFPVYTLTSYRANPDFVKVIEQLGDEANGNPFCLFEVKEIPNDSTDWMVLDDESGETLYYVWKGKIMMA